MKKNLFVLYVVCACITLQAQDLHFSQFYEMPLLRNPALSGVFTGLYRVQSVYRNQWQSIKGVNNSPNPFRTVGAGVEYKFKGYCIDENAALVGGLQVLRDQAGDSRFTRTTGLFSLNYRQTIARNKRLSLAVCGGPVLSTFDPSNLQWDDQYVNYQYSPANPTRQPIPFTGKNYFDLGAGTVLNGGDQEADQWYVGVAVYHLNKPQVGFSSNPGSYDTLPRRVTFSGGLVLLAGESGKFKMYADHMFQGRQHETVVGIMYQHSFPNESGTPDEGVSISGGAFIRYQDAFIPVMNLQKDQWSVGLSYDVNISGLSVASGARGGFELTLKYRGIIPSRKESCTRQGCSFDN